MKVNDSAEKDQIFMWEDETVYFRNQLVECKIFNTNIERAAINIFYQKVNVSLVDDLPNEEEDDENDGIELNNNESIELTNVKPNNISLEPINNNSV